jgi:hypothetical protein
MIINKDTMMNTQTTVLLIGALAKVMELSRSHCSVLAEQTVIALQALARSQELPLSLKAQIEEMLDSLEEQYQLDQQDPSHKLKSVSQDSEAFCIRSVLTRALPLYADASLE